VIFDARNAIGILHRDTNRLLFALANHRHALNAVLLNEKVSRYTYASESIYALFIWRNCDYYRHVETSQMTNIMIGEEIR
jgi:hypothetical protein